MNSDRAWLLVRTILGTAFIVIALSAGIAGLGSLLYNGTWEDFTELMPVFAIFIGAVIGGGYFLCFGFISIIEWSFELKDEGNQMAVVLIATAFTIAGIASRFAQPLS